MGLGLGLLENSYPYYPSVDHRGGEFGAYLGPALQDLPELDNVILENPSVDGPFGAKAIGEMANNAQPPAIANAIHDAIGVWVTEMPATPERVLAALQEQREPRREGKRVIFDDPISVRTLSSNDGAGLLQAPMAESSPFRTWNGRDAWEFVDGVHLHAIGGEQVLLCQVQYGPGKQVPWHNHENTEQVMIITGGEVEMTIEDETKTLKAGDVVVVNRGLHHKLYSENGVIVHRSARAGAARPRARPGPRPRARPRRRRAARGEVGVPPGDALQASGTRSRCALRRPRSPR